MIHENYNEAESLNADIAILHLPSALTFNDYVQPICLPSSAAAAGTKCVATGWGATHSELVTAVFRAFLLYHPPPHHHHHIIIIILFESGNMAHTQTHKDKQTYRQDKYKNVQ